MVPPYSHRIPRVRWYSGYGLATPHFPYRTLTLFGWLSHAIRVCIVDRLCRPNPIGITTYGLASSAFARHYSRNLGWFLFLSLLRCFSSGGSPRNAMDSRYAPWFFTMGVSPFGNPRIEAHLQLPVAYRSLSRPSSAPDAKAFTLRSCSLELSIDRSLYLCCSLNCLSFINKFYRDSYHS